MATFADCGDDCQVQCPDGNDAWCIYSCDKEGNCKCKGGCTPVSSDGFLPPEETNNIWELLRNLFPDAPIDPVSPMVLTYPRMYLWQFAYIMSGLSKEELYLPASRAFEEVPEFSSTETIYNQLLEEFGIRRDGS